MNKKTKLIIISAVSTVVIIITIIICLMVFKRNSNNEDEYIHLIETVEGNDILVHHKGLELSDVRFKYNNGITKMLFKITNISNKDINKNTFFKIILLDTFGKNIKEVESNIGPIKKDEVSNLSIDIFGDYSNIKSFKLIVIDK